MNKKIQKPKINSIETIFRSNLFSIESVKIKFSNGVRKTYERIRPAYVEAVMVVPFLDDHLLVIREYGVGIEDYELGFPKGTVNPGENIVQAANRELMEEIGFSGNSFTYIRCINIVSSYFSNKMHIMVAQNLSPYKLQGDEPEPLTLVYWPISHMLKLLDEPDFSEARNISALLLVYKWLTT